MAVSDDCLSPSLCSGEEPCSQDGLPLRGAAYRRDYEMKNKNSYYESGFGHGLLFAIGFITAMVVCSLVPIKLFVTLTEWFGLSSSIKAFFQNEKFLFPFFSTLGATLTVLIFQFVSRYVSEKKKKIFAISYMYDVSLRVIEANLILKKHTILPHIGAIERAFEGEAKFVHALFESDDFKILTDNSLNFSLLPEEHKVLIGCDNIKLIQAFEAMLYFFGLKTKSEQLNTHATVNLHSESAFVKHDASKQTEILETYLNNLFSVKHENDRAIWFALHVVLPALNQYSNSLSFLGFNRNSIKSTKNILDTKIQVYKEFLPERNLMGKKKKSGIQAAL
ncbi:MAG: hypothetical protein K9K75_02580 [Deltaproteobacteria bacterium]|nr:hypothetical protein [Deltaproteobacteria bacterium]